MADTKLQTRDQRQANDAWAAVASYGDKNLKDLSTTCKKTCTRVLVSGLGPALAFALTKTDDQHRAVRDALGKHLGKGDPSALLQALIGGTAEDLRRKTDDALSFLTWMARLADGKAKQAEGKAKP